MPRRFDPPLQDEDLLQESHRERLDGRCAAVGRGRSRTSAVLAPTDPTTPLGVTGLHKQVATYVVSSTMSRPRLAAIDGALSG